MIGPAALPGLIERLQQGSAEMRRQLLRQASELQEKNSHLGDLFAGVLTCLKHESDKVRQAAVRVLRGCKRRSAEGARLVEAMIWQERDRETRCDAINVLARISPNPKAVAATFAEVQKDRDAEVLAAVPAALCHLELSPRNELELLHIALGDRSKEVRNAAACRAISLGPAATPLLHDLLRMVNGLDPKDWGYYCVTRALEAMGSAATPALETLRAEARAEGR